MRILGRLLVLALLVPLGWLAGVGAASLGGATRGEAPGRDPADARAVVAYQLDAEDATVFPLVGGPDRFRLVTQAAFPLGDPAEPGQSWTYAVAFELLAADGSVLASGLRHEEAGLELCLGPDGRAFSLVTLPELRLRSTLAKAQVVDLAATPGVVAVRLRLASRGEGVSQVLARVHQREPISDRAVRAAWARLGDAEREALAEEVGVPLLLLAQDERDDLLRRRWHPVGPQGAEGRDFVARTLRLRPSRDCAEPVAEPSLSPGLPVGRDRHARVPLPPGVESAALSFDPLVLGGEGPPGAEVELRWHGIVPGLPLVERARLSSGQELTLPARGFALEVVPDRPLALRVRAAGGTGEADLAPRPLLARLFRAGRDAPVTFPVSHVDEEPTPFRLHVRCLCAPGEVPPAVRAVAFEWLDEAGVVLRSGTAEVALGPAPLERAAEDPVARVLGPAYLHFNLPPEVRALRVSAAQPILVGAANRPPGAPATLVPPDRMGPDGLPLTLPLWFPLRPLGWRELVEGEGSATVVVQEQVIPTATRLLLDRAAWEPWEPWPTAGLVEVLAPYDRRPALGALAGGDVFMPLSPGRPTFLDLRATAADGPRVAPDLLALDGGDGASVRLAIDGRPALSAPLTPPPLVPRWHRFEPLGAAGPLLISNAVPTREAWVLRRAVPLAAGATRSFRFEKRGEGREFAVIHLFATGPRGTGGRIDVELAVGPRAPGPLPDWTPSAWRADLPAGELRPGGARRLPDEPLGAERVLVVPFGADLPPGVYDLRLRLTGIAALVALTRTAADPAWGLPPQADGAVGTMACRLDDAGAWSCEPAPRARPPAPSGTVRPPAGTP